MYLSFLGKHRVMKITCTIHVYMQGFINDFRHGRGEGGYQSLALM